MAGYRLRLTICIAIVGFYTLIANEPRFSRYQELFPFFNWSLFSYSGSIRTDMTVAFTSINGTAFEEPKLIGSLYDEFPLIVRNVNFNKAIWHLYEARVNGRDADAERIRASVESNYFSHLREAEYKVVRIRYRPIDRYKDPSKVAIESVVGEYRYDEGK